MIDQLLVLGTSGDLTGRHLVPALAHLQEAGRLPEALGIVGVARDDWDTAALRLQDGDPTLSIRGDEAEECWRITEPILAAWAEGPVPLQAYPAGSAGPRTLPDHGGDRSR